MLEHAKPLQPSVQADSAHHAHLLSMQVTLIKPLGLRFARGNDGGCYINKSDAGLGNTDDRIQVMGTNDCYMITHSRTCSYMPI